LNGLDLLLVLAAVVAAAGGWRMGFLRRFSSWLGAAVGLAVAIALLPDVVRWLRLESDVAILVGSVAVLMLLASIGQGIGALFGARLHHGVVGRRTVARNIDSVGGSALGVVGIAVLTWLVVPVMADTSGWPAASARNSVIAGLVDEHLPGPPPQIARLERELAGGQFPQLFSGLRSAPDIPPPPAGSPVGPALLDETAPSAVRLTSAACGRVQRGSGFMVAPEIMATNAHVVAAATTVTVETADGASAEGRVVAFDPATDLALVAAPVQRTPLRIAEPAVGDRGLVLGFPGGGPFTPSPFEVGQRMTATGFDIYDRSLVQRDLLALASALEPGDSGSAVLRADGTVVGVAVAVAPDRRDVAYALDSSELSELLDAVSGRGLAPVDTGPCLR
jgi:S1-C subfamily serine protease